MPTSCDYGQTHKMEIQITPGRPLRGELSLPGDKSISHRTALFAGLAGGRSRIENFLLAGVTQPLLDALTKLGVEWEFAQPAGAPGYSLDITSEGMNKLREPCDVLDCANSGTTIRFLAGALAAALVLLRPWLLAVGAALALAWGASLWLTRTGHERGITNDLLLVGQAALAVPLLWAVTIDAAPPAPAWWACLVCAVFFTGSVLHVKSLMREADDPRWALASRLYHLAALGMGLLSPWLLLPFGAAAIRAFAVPAGSRPGIIGAVETVVSVLVVIGGAAAL